MKSLFGKLAFVFAAGVAIAALSGVAISGQNLNISLGVKSPSGNATLATSDAIGDTVVGKGVLTSLGLTGATSVVKTGVGRIAKVNVLTASGVVQIYDLASTSGVSAANQIVTIPSVVGVYDVDMPVTTGITIAPASSVVSISYQ